MEEILKLIKRIILNTAEEFGIVVKEIILFGSRARGDFKEDSDWDILVITEERVKEDIKYDFIYKVRKKIIYKLDIPVDIIIVDSEHAKKYANVYGSITGMAVMEGRVI